MNFTHSLNLTGKEVQCKAEDYQGVGRPHPAIIPQVPFLSFCSSWFCPAISIPWISNLFLFPAMEKVQLTASSSLCYHCSHAQNVTLRALSRLPNTGVTVGQVQGIGITRLDHHQGIWESPVGNDPSCGTCSFHNCCPMALTFFIVCSTTTPRSLS